MASMGLVHIGMDMAGDAIERTRSLLALHGPRVTGTGSCRQAAESLAEAMRPYCDRVETETFTLHPGALFLMGRIVALSYVAALLLLLLGGAFIYGAPAVCVVTLLYVCCNYGSCGKHFDCLFRKAHGYNVYGAIEPTGEAERQVLITGHHDSPYVFNFLAHHEKWAGIRFLLGTLSYLYVAVLSCIAAVTNLLRGAWNLRGAGLVIALIGLVFALPLYTFISRKPSPGAGDNLNSSSMAVEIVKYFSEMREKGHPLSRTRVIALSTDGEEVGLRGALAYAARHRETLTGVPTSVLVIDSVYRLRDLLLITRDKHGTIPLSPRITGECREIAEALGIPIRCHRLPVGGGSTDAAAFAKSGIPAASIIGVCTNMMCEGHIYHTEADTVEAIEPAGVAATLDIAVNLILRTDQA